jgi:single-strand DNA-binding protein
MKGDPVMATGELRTNEYTTKEGIARSDLEMRATAVGPDLARCIAKIERHSKTSSVEESGESDETVAA